MMTVKGADKNLTKSGLEDWIEGKEQIHGPLTAIEARPDRPDKPGGTVGTFDDDADTPTGRAILVLNPATTPAPAGKTKLCDGQAYISGNAIAVAVYR